MNIRMFDDGRKQWCVRVVEAGERYGLDFCLTHSGDEPLVEFYDTEFPHTILGQFVARYYLETILEHSTTLRLDGGIPEWTVSGGVMRGISAWLHSVGECHAAH